MKGTYIRSLFFCVLLITTVYVISEERQIVCCINGSNIYESDIEATIPLDNLNMHKDVKVQKMCKIRGKIFEIIFKDAVKRYGINVTDEEVRKRVDKYFFDARVTEDTVNEIKRRGLLIGNALSQVVINKCDPVLIYSNELADIISYYEWQNYLLVYNDADKIKRFISLVPNSIDDMKSNSWVSARKDIEKEKLEQIICADIEVTEKDVDLYCKNKLYKDPIELDDETKSKIRLKILSIYRKAKLTDWWIKEIRSLNMEVYDTNFYGIKEWIIEGLSQSNRAEKIVVFP